VDNRKLYNLYSLQNIKSHQTKDAEVGELCSTYSEIKKCI
jgi:hypothetical protein